MQTPLLSTLLATKWNPWFPLHSPFQLFFLLLPILLAYISLTFSPSVILFVERLSPAFPKEVTSYEKPHPSSPNFQLLAKAYIELYAFSYILILVPSSLLILYVHFVHKLYTPSCLCLLINITIFCEDIISLFKLFMIKTILMLLLICMIKYCRG